MYAQTSTRQEERRSVLKTVFEFLMSKLTSRHGKRIIFITSLYFQVVRIERLKAEAITKLNDIMGLATNRESLRFPAAIRGMVWGNTDLTAALNEDILDREISDVRAREISENVVNLAPSWLRYDRKEMVTDVVDLIRCGGQLAQAA